MLSGPVLEQFLFQVSVHDVPCESVLVPVPDLAPNVPLDKTSAGDE